MYSERNEKLYNTVMKFMIDNRVTCSEAIYQTDKVIENAYEFIDDLYQLVEDDLDDWFENREEE